MVTVTVTSHEVIEKGIEDSGKIMYIIHVDLKVNTWSFRVG